MYRLEVVTNKNKLSKFKGNQKILIVIDTSFSFIVNAFEYKDKVSKLKDRMVLVSLHDVVSKNHRLYFDIEIHKECKTCFVGG